MLNIPGYKRFNKEGVKPLFKAGVMVPDDGRMSFREIEDNIYLDLTSKVNDYLYFTESSFARKLGFFKN